MMEEDLLDFLVHPHACGELGAAYSIDFLAIGSSPRMWGTLHIPLKLIVHSRFIPTHVGNSPETVGKGFA